MPNTTPSTQFNFDLDSFGKDSKEVEIEYAPEIEEEGMSWKLFLFALAFFICSYPVMLIFLFSHYYTVSTTTRASIRRPTKKNQNKHQQQSGRQKKSGSLGGFEKNYCYIEKNERELFVIYLTLVGFYGAVKR